MKRVLLLVLFVSLAFGLFADDAKVLPASIFRLYLAPSYAFGSEAFDADGEKVDYAYGDYSFFNLGAALEYGITDSISAAVQWAPGANLTSEFSDNEYLSAEGLFELFAGAKIQVLGAQGLVKNDAVRIAVAPGVMIPMSFGYDAEAEAANYVATQTYIGSGGAFGALTAFNLDPANSALALGARFYADYIINDMLFLNIYCEYIKYLEKDAADDMTATALNTLMAAGYETVNYGYKLTGEVDINFSKSMGNGLILGGGVPVSYVTHPAVAYDDADAVEDDASYVIAVNPDVSVFATSLPLPLEFKVSYKLPLAGQNDRAMNTLTAQIKAYLKF